MLSLTAPNRARLEQFLDREQNEELSYPGIGTTVEQAPPPAGFRPASLRVPLGEGRSPLAAAKEALRRWEQFRFPWVRIWPPVPAIRPGEQVAIAAQSMGLWWLNVCRIVYVLDEPDRFGFANGTLPGHVGSGEERFLVEIDPQGEAWYEISSFSRPQHPLAHFARPWMRHVQRQFRRDSAAAMQRAVCKALGERQISSYLP